MPKPKKASWAQIGMVTVLTSLCLGAMYGLKDVPKQALTAFAKAAEKAEYEQVVEHKYRSIPRSKADLDRAFLGSCIVLGLFGFALGALLPKTHGTQ